MITTLRQAGFTATSTLADVAKRTGLEVADIKARVGVSSATETLGEKALDQKFIFPDSFAAKGGLSTSADTQALVGRPDKSSGLGVGNTGAAGLLRVQLNNVEMKAPAHRGTEARALKEAILSQVSTLDEAKALARALGAKPGEIGGHSLLGFAHELARWMQSHSQGADKLKSAQAQAQTQPFVDKPAVFAAGSIPDATTVPANRLHVAVRDALVKGGIDSNEKVSELARRLGAAASARDAPPFHALSSLVQHLIARGSPEKMAAAVADAVKEPISGTKPQTISVDVAALPSDVSKFPHGNAYLAAMRRAIVAGGVDTIEHARALSSRVGVDVTHDTPEHHVFQTILALLSRNGDDAAKTGAELARALSTPLEPLVVPDGLPPFVDASAIKTASSRAALVDAMLSIAKTPAQLEELATRLDVVNSLPGATTLSTKQYASKIADAASAAQIAAALE